jgi:cholesterol transport system auxiliary component
MPLMKSTARAIAAAAAVLALSGCLSLGAKVPAQLLNLTPTSAVAAGTGASGSADNALAVADIQAPQKLDVTRVPVTTGGAGVAYLKDAQWVEKPARLFGRLLSDTIRAKGNRLVVSGSDAEDLAATKLTGTLSAMDYDAAQGAVVVRYDAVLELPGGKIQTRRFESVVPGVPAAAAPVADAMNRAANEIAAQVADWVG